MFQGEKTRTRVTGAFRAPEGLFRALAGVAFEGYEIHMGRTESGAAPLAEFTTQTGERRSDGLSAGNVWGCYVHGIFDKAAAAAALVNALLAAKGWSRARPAWTGRRTPSSSTTSWRPACGPAWI